MEQEWSDSIEAICERCGPVLSRVPVIVDFGDIEPRPEAANPILDGTIHQLVCPSCGAALGAVDAPLLLHCPGYKPPLVFFPPVPGTTEADPKVLKSLGMRLVARRPDLQSGEPLGVYVMARQLLLQIAAGLQSNFRELAATLSPRVEPLASMVERFVRAASWNASRRMVREHPELLMEEAQKALAVAAARALAVENKGAAHAFVEHAGLLRRCKEIGIEGAFAEHVGAEANDMWSDADVPQPIADALDEAGAAEKRYRLTGDERDLDKMAACWERVLSYPALVETPLHVRLGVWNSAGHLFARRYDVRGHLEDLDKVIACERNALSAVPEDSPSRLMHLNNLGNRLRMRYEHDGRTADMEEAIDVCNRAVEATPKDSAHLWPRLANLGTARLSRYKHHGRVEDVDAAIAVFREAIEGAPKDSADWPKLLANLGSALSMRYAESRAIEDDEEALVLFRQALEAATPDSPSWPGILKNLGTSLIGRYARTKEMSDLYEAIALFRQAVQAISNDPVGRPGYLYSLSKGLRAQYEHTKQLEDLDEVIDVQRQAVAAAPRDSPDRRMFLDNLAATLFDRHGQSGNMEDMHEAIAIQRQAMDAAIAVGSHDRLSFLDTIGERLRDRYNRTGQLADLEESVAHLRSALEATDSESPEILEHLGTSLITRHGHTGRMEDLQEGIHYLRMASVAAPNRPLLLNRLGQGIWDEYRRAGHLEDLREAVAVFRQAMEAVEKTSPNWASIANNLGGCLSMQHTHTQRIEDLQEAIHLFRQALEVTPKVSVDWPGFLANLAINLTVLYKYTKRIEDLHEAIATSRKAVEATPATSPHRPLILCALADSLRTQYEQTGNDEVMAESITLFRLAVDFGRVVDPEHAIRAAHTLAWWMLSRGAFREALDAYDDAIAIVEALYDEQPLRSGKQSWLRQAQTIYAEVAYCKARLGDLFGAVLALETGRARLLWDALDRNRTDLEYAEKQSPEAVARYRKARARLHVIEANDSRERRSEKGIDRARHADEIRKARADLQNAVNAIRALPGYETFQALPTVESIKAALMPGLPVVYLAAAHAGGIALIVSPTATGMQVLPTWLDGLTIAAVLDILQGGNRGKSTPTSWIGAQDRWLARPDDPQARAEWHDSIERITGTLWDLVMGPVIGLLREHYPGTQQVALIPCGYLALFPLHAARTSEGIAGSHSTLDEVAVCYAPSLRALKHAHEISERREKATRRLFAVNDPRPTSGLPLPNAGHEIDTAAGFFRDTVVFSHEECSRNDVLDAITRADVCHFACHGINNWQEPLHSGLLMANNELLTVEDLFYLTTRDARLAVLSACETGIVGTDVPDEAVALPAAFLQTGFAGVVASLWSVYDISASLLMAKFYELWLGEHLNPAEALRKSQIWLRDLKNHEIVTHLERLVPELVPRMAFETAAPLHFSALVQDPNDTPFAHPVHWAAFYLTGV